MEGIVLLMIEYVRLVVGVGYGVHEMILKEIYVG